MRLPALLLLPFLAAAPARAVSPPPVAQNDSLTMHAGQKALLPVLANDTGDITAGAVAIVTAPQFGTAVVDANGRILYTQTTGSPATDSFTYRVSGPGGASNTATVALQFATQLRIASPTLNVPAAPPATTFQLVNGFPNLAFTQPLCLVTPPGETQRLFVLEKAGRVQLIPNVTAATPTSTVFLNLPSAIASGETISSAGEQGLLGLAFHPNFATNRFFYVFYSVRKADNLLYERVARFTASATNPNAADPTSQLILIEQKDDATNHNGGNLAFGPDGFLYISLGDEGDQNDTNNNAQRIDKDFFSAIARIDVDKKSGSVGPTAHAAVIRDNGVARYAIPADNPFVGATSFNGAAVNPAAVRTEFYAVGFRNPWRFSFDPATGELWCGDVGQDNYEEIDLVTKGGNYGWSFREAKHNGPKTAPAGFTSIDPVYEYSHGSGTFQGNSITGGVVYRGSRISSLVGSYLFADYVSGNVWSLVRNGAAAPTVTRLTGQNGLVGIGVDPSNGDPLFANYNNGSLQRLTGGAATGSFPQTLSATGLFADLTDLSPNPGVLPYQPNLAFWSDFAVKRRWFTIPNAASQMTWAKDAVWNYPAGQIWVKHFDLELTRTNPPTTGGTGPRKRLETRLIVKNATGAYGVSYRWNDAGTDATLVPDEGVTFPVNITENGVARVQNWQIPSRASCLSCHNAPAGYALSFNTRQLNLTNNLNGFTGNQLDLLRTAGYFSNPPSSPNLLPRHLRPDETTYPAEARARSYLAVNCAYCHMAGGSAPSWDGRPELTLAQTGLINGTATSASHPGDQLIVPDDLAHSVVYDRVAVTNGYTRMPPIASSELDQSAIALLQDWIGDFSQTHPTYDQWRLAQFGSATSAAGAPDFDADGDGVANSQEWLTGSNPRNASSVFAPTVAADLTTISLSFDLPENRTATVETSTNLQTWSLWDVPGNGGTPQANTLTVMTGVPAGPSQFFRISVVEN